MMKRLFPGIVLCLLMCFASHGRADQMSDAQKKDLIAQLRGMKGDVEARKAEKIKSAVSLLSSIVHDENAAMSLFEKSYKKVNFDNNEYKKDRDWREWKNQNREKLALSANKRAISYQARWALICLDAVMTSDEELDPQKYMDRAMSLITDVVTDFDVLSEADSMFNTSVLDGPIGQACGLNGYLPNRWPSSVMQFDQIVDQLALARAREKQDYETLRKGWNFVIGATKKTIEGIRAAAEKQAKQAAREIPSGGPRRRDVASMIRMVSSQDIDQTLEMMEMIREADCYRAGDQINAAKNILRLIAKSKNSDRREMYINGMKQLLEMQNPGGEEMGGRRGMRSSEN